MDIFDDYKELKETYNSFMLDRFSDAPFSEAFECIFDVIDYIYECEEAGEEVSEDISDLFAFGYRYLNEKLLYLSSYLDQVFKTDDNLKANYNKLDLLFYVMDFITDAKLESLSEDKIKLLEDLEDEINESINKNIPLKKDISDRIEETSKKVFRKGFHGFMESFEVLYDAITFGIDDSEKDDGEFYKIEK